MKPGSLSVGDHDVTLRVSEVPANAIVSGNVEVRSHHVIRASAVTGGAVNATSSEPASNLRFWG